MSSALDRKFSNQFSLIIGVLVGVAAGIYFLAISLARPWQTERRLQDPEYQKVVAERVGPPWRVAVAGRDNAALAILPDRGAELAPSAMTMPTSGVELYEQVCTACHDKGIAGAPRIGDASAWAPRVARGKSTLYQHAIEGFKGQTGVMPPKGGRTDLSDDLVRAAVDHIMEASH
jgi:cytochrome c5